MEEEGEKEEEELEEKGEEAEKRKNSRITNSHDSSCDMCSLLQAMCCHTE